MVKRGGGAKANRNKVACFLFLSLSTSSMERILIAMLHDTEQNEISDLKPRNSIHRLIMVLHY